MAATERLALLITANGSAAISEFQKTGVAAETSMKKMDEGSARVGANLVRVGAGMAALGGIALVGLAKAAQAAQEEDLAIAKLNNSIAQSPELAGASSAAFLDQAAALQDVTRFSDDATISAQAMLGTFHLTQSEILGLTPLVQDLAAKFDLDLVNASKLVGKAMDGNAGALSRTGVRIDAAAFATDRYSAVLSALRENAGGFAREEGATFNGQLQILKNNLGDVEEGIGRGAVQAFNDLLGPVKALSNAFTSLSPGVQGAVGKFATFGAVALVAVGSVTMLYGSLLKARAAYVTVQAAAAASAGATAEAAAATEASTASMVAWPVAVAAGVAALAVWANSLSDAGVDVQRFAALTDEELLRSAATLVHFGDQTRALNDLFAESPELAQRFIDVLSRAATTDDERETVDALRERLEELKHGAELAALGLDETATSAEEAAAQLQALTQRIDDYVHRLQDSEASGDALQESLQGLFTTFVENGQAWQGDTDKARENRAAMRGVVSAAAEHISSMIEQNASERRLQAVKAATINRLIQARNAGLLSADAFERLTREINNVPGVPPINVTIYGAETAISQLQRISQEALTAAHAVSQISGSLAGGGTYNPPESARAPESALAPVRERVRPRPRRVMPAPVVVVG